MKIGKALFIAVSILLECIIAPAQQTFMNGNLITGSALNDGTPAPAGTFWSEIQPPIIPWDIFPIPMYVKACWMILPFRKAATGTSPLSFVILI